MFFRLVHKDSKTRARTGIIRTDHGDIPTPCFMAVGTQGSVKALGSDDLLSLGASVVLNNTYHLHLRPGEDVVARLGGVHKFMGWNGPILTDSGGFQVLSLGASGVTIDKNGVTFRSHIDGRLLRLTPASSIKIQKKLGADIIMAFDECTPEKVPLSYTKEAMDRTHAWARQSLEQFLNTKPRHKWKQFIFGIIQGGANMKLRVESAKFITGLQVQGRGFDGIAIGGESIGSNMEITKLILEELAPYLPEGKPRYTMGVGYSPNDLFEVVERGIDMFDCVAPTRMARNGALFVCPKTAKKLRLPKGKSFYSITNSRFKKDSSPIDPLCTCYVCQTYSRAYLSHLFKSKELSAFRLATIHNLHFFLSLMREMREQILKGGFLKFKNNYRY